MNRGRHTINWIDREREPQVAPNPRFPDGIDIPPQYPERPFCKVSLPYPAKRIGHYIVDCKTCRLSVIITTAGRRDDPRSVALNCKDILQ